MNTSNLRKACLFISILAPTYPAQVIADMFSWFKEYDVHLSPVVKGKITFNGNPVANVKVFRELDYDTSYNDDTASNKMGQFQFAEKNIKSRQPGNKLNQSTIRQVISADYQGKTYVLWYTSTPSITPHATFQRALSNLNCELTSPEEKFSFANIEHPDFPHGVVSICRWSD
ncbi:DUF6795 domain-containing protein [Rheinheimera baltica]|uniref:DUF6795 domain-containing protein n=1 Tax=Rheinheimera baltica TaxID=67576 RepID=UPI0027402199|nr:DUF6795 domain-containing protein [Rheinheimera baltica]MDP5188416.1 hypothetical protein [Rheinheimera baltica]